MSLVFLTHCCRGSAPHAKGCWLGLRDPQGSGDWRWISRLAVGVPSQGTFLDWRRDEPNNHSISEGVPAGTPTAPGERCAALVPWQEDPLLQEQGSWNDVSCDVAKPFLCQVFASTERYTLTVTGGAVFESSAMLEGGIVRVGTQSGVALLRHVAVSRSGRLVVDTKATDCVLGTVFLDDGATLEVLSATARTLSLAQVIATPHSMQPFLRIGNSTTLTSAPDPTCTAAQQSLLLCSASQAEVTIDARAFVSGRLVLSGNTRVTLLQVSE